MVSPMPTNGSQGSAKRHSGWKIPSELRGIALWIFCIFLLLSLVSFRPNNPSADWIGLVGYCTAWLLVGGLGLGSYLFVAYLAWIGWRQVGNNPFSHPRLNLICFFLALSSTCILLSLVAETFESSYLLGGNWVFSESISLNTWVSYRDTRYYLGGIPFYNLYRDIPVVNLQRLLSNFGTGVVFSTLLVAVLLVMSEIHPLVLWKIACALGRKLLHGLVGIVAFFNRVVYAARTPTYVTEAVAAPPPAVGPMRPPVDIAPQPLVAAPEEPLRLPKKPSAPKKPLEKPKTASSAKYQLPTAALLTDAKKTDVPSLQKDLRRQAAVLESTLLNFGIEAKVGKIHCGPRITSFEVHPAIGVKVQKIKALENDIALNMQAASIRIVAPIPGKAAVGIEIPSLHPQEVSFKEMLLRYQASHAEFALPLLLGQTVDGSDVATDLTKMPHLIIAGATGSGKSVCINTIIISLLMTAGPEEVKLLLVDPKKVELTPYSELPHMIAPVITEPQEACAALNWLVKEMERRYEIFKQVGVRHIRAFNNRTIDTHLESALDIEIPARMYYLVAIIDELADLMMASTNDIETPIARIAQMARAVGIHLILATQRPSREVITGLIKANFPARVAFKVSSRVNSQIILDEIGAEALLGNGDLLLLPPGGANLIRAQGAFIRDEDINKVVHDINAQLPPNYLLKGFEMSPEEGSDEGIREGRDSLYTRAVEIAHEAGAVSTTYLQRKLKIGYARAASLMDELEQAGVVGPQEGAKPRRVIGSAPKRREEFGKQLPPKAEAFD